jgi:hypothetical protein
MNRALIGISAMLAVLPCWALAQTAPAPEPASTSTSTATPGAASASAQPFDVATFSNAVDENLLRHGAAVFNQPEGFSLGPNQFGYRPLELPVGGPFGPLYGDASLLVGVNVAGPGSMDYPNLEFLGTLNYMSHIRGHIQANLEKIPFDTPHKRTVGLAESYAEYFTDGMFGQQVPAIAPDSYHVSLRMGKFGAQQFPFIDPLTLNERLPGIYTAYTGGMLTAELDSPTGLGVHGSLYQRISGTGTTGDHFVGDTYALYRGYQPSCGVFYEGRLGLIPRTTIDSPANAAPGAQGYIGYQGRSYGAGFFAGGTFRQGTTVGVSITLGRNPITEMFGLGPSKALFEPKTFGLEIPVANVFLGAATHPGKNEVPVGQLDEVHLWNNGTSSGVGSTDVVTVGSWGQQSGKDVRRVVSATPWWLYQETFDRVPLRALPRTGDQWENGTHYRSDVQYTYYRVMPQSDVYRVVVTVVDAQSNHALGQARVALTDLAGDVYKAPDTASNGLTRLNVPRPGAGPAMFHVTAVAPYYALGSVDATLSPDVLNQVTIQLNPAPATVSGAVTDSATGKPVPDVEVALLPQTGTYTLRMTGPDGKYQFNDVALGAYTLRFHRPGYSEETRPLIVTSGRPIKVDIRTNAQRGGVMGRVIDSNNNPIANAVVVVRNDAGETVATRSGVSQEGTFVQRLDPGTYTITVTAPGFIDGQATATVEAAQLQSVTVTLQRQP